MLLAQTKRYVQRENQGMYKQTLQEKLAVKFNLPSVNEEQILNSLRSLVKHSTQFNQQHNKRFTELSTIKQDLLQQINDLTPVPQYSKPYNYQDYLLEPNNDDEEKPTRSLFKQVQRPPEVVENVELITNYTEQRKQNDEFNRKLTNDMFYEMRSYQQQADQNINVLKEEQFRLRELIGKNESLDIQIQKLTKQLQLTNTEIHNYDEGIAKAEKQNHRMEEEVRRMQVVITAVQEQRKKLMRAAGV